MHPLGAQRRALHDAEPVLLVDDREPELAERDRILHERMRPDHEVERPAGELGVRLAPLLRRALRRSAAPCETWTTRAAGGC